MNHFEETGMNVIHVADYNDAYSILDSKSIDIVVVDMDSNYQESFRFTYRVKHNKHLSHVFVIALSASYQKHGIFIETRTREAKKWMNIDVWVHKPINAKNLYILIKKEVAKLEGIDTSELDSEPEYKLM
jgi:DNA-binding response OmpR family regulator